MIPLENFVHQRPRGFLPTVTDNAVVKRGCQGGRLGAPGVRLEGYRPGDTVTVRIVRSGKTTYEVWYGTRGNADRLLTDQVDFGTNKVPTIPGLMVGGNGHDHNPQMYECMGNDGEQMWQEFIRKHENIFLVVSGHIGGDGLGRLTSKGEHGNPVHQLLANYQMNPTAATAGYGS